MSRKEHIVAAIRVATATAGTVRSGLAERLLAGVLLAVAVAGSVLIPRLVVGASPQHELDVGTPSMTAPPVVLAPGLPAQKSRLQTAAVPPGHAIHVDVVPSASTSQSTARVRPATTPAPQRPAATQSPPPAQPQPQPQPPAQSESTIHALNPAPLDSTEHDLRVHGRSASHGAAPKLHAPPHPHPTPELKAPKQRHEPQPQASPLPPGKLKPHPGHPTPAHTSPPPTPHPGHPKPQHTLPPKLGLEAEQHGQGNGQGNGHKP